MFAISADARTHTEPKDKTTRDIKPSNVLARNQESSSWKPIFLSRTGQKFASKDLNLRPGPSSFKGTRRVPYYHKGCRDEISAELAVFVSCIGPVLAALFHPSASSARPATHTPARSTMASSSGAARRSSGRHLSMCWPGLFSSSRSWWRRCRPTSPTHTDWQLRFGNL